MMSFLCIIYYYLFFYMSCLLLLFFFFFFNDTATTEIYTLSLHDALPISDILQARKWAHTPIRQILLWIAYIDRKSTRLNSSHTVISYAVFCLKKKKKKNIQNSSAYKAIVYKKTYD